MNAPRHILWIGSPPPADAWHRLQAIGLRLVIVPANVEPAVAQTSPRLVVLSLGDANGALADRIGRVVREAPAVWLVALVPSADRVAAVLAAGAHDAAVSPSSSERLLQLLAVWLDASVASGSRAAAIDPLVVRVRTLEAQLSDMELESRRLRDLSDLDDLTGLANGRQLRITLRQLVAHAWRYGDPISVLALGVDDFERTQRAPGKPAERFVRHLADVVRTCVRGCDVPGRLEDGGFAVALPSTAEHAARRVADRIRTRASLVKLPAGRAITMSAGIATLSLRSEAGGPDPTADELLASAVAALGSAHRRGGDRVALAATDDDEITNVRRR